MSHNGGSPSEMDPEMGIGLVHKYNVQRVVDPEGKHAECRFFVLDPQHDSGARFALRAYKVWAANHGYDALAADLEAWLAEVGP